MVMNGHAVPPTMAPLAIAGIANNENHRFLVNAIAMGAPRNNAFTP